MANSYEKRDIRLVDYKGLVLGVQPEGIQEGGFTRLMNTKIYREGAIGLRDQRDLFAGLKTTDLEGRALWINYITRYDKEFILAFHGSSLNAWRWAIPDPAFTSDTTTPGIESVVSFNNFLPEKSLPTTVSVLPNERSIPVTYFTKPGVVRMWKFVTTEAESRSGGGTTRRTPGVSTGDARQLSATDSSIVAPPRPPSSGGGLRVYYWGINAPGGRPTVVVQDGTGGAKDIAAPGISSDNYLAAYDYIYTYVNRETGHEGNPSAGLEATVNSSQKAILVTCPINDIGGDDQIGAVRIYRKGGSITEYLRVAEVKIEPTRTTREGEVLINQSVEYLDKKSDAELQIGGIIAKFDNYVPFVSTNQAGDAVWNAVCPFIFGPFADKVIMGLGEENQPGNVFWTNPGRADSSRAENNVQVTSSRDPLVTGVIYNGYPYVASRGDWYALDFLAGEAGTAIFTPRKTKAGKGPLGPWAACAGDMIYFVTPEGVMMTDGQSEAAEITSDLLPIFHNESVGEYKPIDFDAAQELFRLYWADPELHFIYPDTDGELQHVIFQERKWRSEEFARPGLTANYPSEPWDNSPLMHATCIYDDTAWPARSVFIGTDRRAIFRQRPFRSSAIEIAWFAYNGSPVTGWEATSVGGWVVGHCRTHTDDYQTPAMLKELGDITLEARNRGTDVTDTDLDAYGELQGALSEEVRGKTALRLYANVEGGSRTIDDGEEPSDALVGQPIGSTVYNATNTARQKYPFAVPDDYVYSSAWDLRFYGQWELNNLTVFWRQDTEVIKHWHMDNLNHNINGWFHVRDGYLDARLYGDATITLTIDGDSQKAQTVDLSPTWTRPDGSSADYTGERYKYYFSFLPMKGKKLTWTIDCSAGMRLYSEGSAINGKSWITGQGYQPVNPFSKGAS